MKKISALTCALLAISASVLADDDGASKNNFGFAGVLSSTNKEELPAINLSIGESLGGPWQLSSGTYYEVEITSDGSGEIALDLANFSRAVWIGEMVVNDLEIRPYGVQSLEFDDAGTIEMDFVAIVPGQYEIKIPNARGDSQILKITIE